MALTIATGFVVDDAIVVVENISRHLERGLSPLEAALVGAKEIGFTVLSISVSLVAVFIPILLMGGIVGRLFREFAVTLSVAIGVSMVVSLTTTPMMCAALLKSKSEEHHGWLFAASERIFDVILWFYEKTLGLVLRFQFLTLLVTLATLGLTIYLYVIVPKGFFPQQDTGRIVGSIQADQKTSFQAMERLLGRLASTVSADPAVDTVIAMTGGSAGTSNAGRMFAVLKPLEERKMSADEVIGRLRGELVKIPGGSLYLQAVQDLRIGGRATGAQYQYTLQGPDLRELNLWGPKLLAKLRKIPNLVDLNTDQQNLGLEAGLTYDRLMAASLGISPQAIDDTLYDAFGQRQVSTMYLPLNQYHVVLEVDPQFRENPDALADLYVRGANAVQVPINEITRYTSDTTPLLINHSGLSPSVTLSFNLVPGYP